MKYAMIANDLVIGIVESETTPYWPPLDTGKQVYAKQCDQSVQIGDKVIDGEILGTKDWFSELKSQKINEIINECQNIIYNGIFITLSNGQKYHFTFKKEDQINLLTIFYLINSDPEITTFPYHSDDNLCEYFSKEDIQIIATTLMNFKTYHTTYCNSLKLWIQNLTSIDVEILNNIFYGIVIPEEYKSNVLIQLEKEMQVIE